MTAGEAERGCPLCGAQRITERNIPTHIRVGCEVAIAARVEMGLPELGYRGHEALNERFARGDQDGTGRPRGVTGRFISAAEAEKREEAADGLGEMFG